MAQTEPEDRLDRYGPHGLSMAERLVKAGYDLSV
jgi:hypothetical protein